MNGSTRLIRKSYAMQRMGMALARAVSAGAANQKSTAARWAAAWGLLCGIHTPGVNLRRGEVGKGRVGNPRRTGSGSIAIASAPAPSPDPIRDTDSDPQPPQGPSVVSGIFSGKSGS